MSSKMDRRSFLLAGGSSYFALMRHPILQILGALATKQAHGAGPKVGSNYIFIHQPGAPARWTFDLFLNPDKLSNVKVHPHIQTKFNSTKNGLPYKHATYSLSKQKGLWVPHIWSQKTAAVGGSTTPMANLLDHMLQIRGIRGPNSAHAFNQIAQQYPVGSSASINALPGEMSTVPIPAIMLGKGIFQSATGKTSVTLTGSGNLISELLQPFSNTRIITAAERGNLASVIKSAEEELDRMALGLVSGTAAHNELRQVVEALYDRQFPDLLTEWNRLFNKYQDLINRSLALKVRGICDRPIGAPLNQRTAIDYSIFGSQDVIPPDQDIRNIISAQTQMDVFASQCALTEFVLLQGGLSQSISLRMQGLRGLAASNNKQNYDEHQVGRHISLYINSMHNMAFGACLIELQNVLKSANIYDQTVMQVGGEFNRIPAQNGSGHGWQGGSVVFYSGKITGPHIIGNIKKDSKGEVWGEGAPNKRLKNDIQMIDHGHIVSTAASLLEVASPVSRRESLVRKQGGKFIPILPKGKIV